MKKKNQEDKRRRYANNEAKEVAHKKNEEEILGCFSMLSGYWGIDRIVLDVTVKEITKDKLLSNNNSLCTIVMNPFGSQESKDVFGNYYKIEIYNSEFGRLKIACGDPTPFTKYSRLELFHSGVNVETGCMKNIWQKYLKAVKILREQYGISLTLSPSVQIIELCFTFASNKLIPLQVRKFIIAAVSSSNIVGTDRYSGTSTPQDKALVKSQLYDSLQNVFYDKTAKAEHLNQISSKVKHDIRVYRIEFCIKKTKLKKDKILKTELLSDLTDEKILNYITQRVYKSINRYINIIVPLSLKSAREYMTIARETDFNNYIKPFDNLFSDDKDDNEFCKLIDNESIVFANFNNIFPNSTVARSRKKMLFPSKPSLASRNRMYGYNIERILSLMLMCLNDGLGCKSVKTSSSPKHYVVFESEYIKEDLELYLRALISSKKKNSHIFYNDLIADRILHQWDPHSNTLPSITHIKKSNKMENYPYFNKGVFWIISSESPKK